MISKEDKLANAVRILLYGNGDLRGLVADLEQSLDEYDGVRPSWTSKLSLISKNLQEEDDPMYDWFSGNKWNYKL